MTLILRTAEELEAAPLGTEAVDAEGDLARRVEGGWTYRPKGGQSHLTPADMVHYGPLVRVSQPALERLDGLDIHAAVWAYMEKYPRTGTGPHRAAKEILALVKERLTP